MVLLDLVDNGKVSYLQDGVEGITVPTSLNFRNYFLKVCSKPVFLNFAIIDI